MPRNDELDDSMFPDENGQLEVTGAAADGFPTPKRGGKKKSASNGGATNTLPGGLKVKIDVPPPPPEPTEAPRPQPAHTAPPADMSPLELLRGGQGEVSVFREAPDVDSTGRKVWTGYAGSLANEAGIEKTISELYGGGLYVLKGRDTHGKPIVAKIKIPGEPKPIAEPPESEQEDYDLPPPSPRAPYAQPYGYDYRYDPRRGYAGPPYGGGYPPYGGFGALPGMGVPPGYGGSVAPAPYQRELEEYKAKAAALEAEKRALELARAKESEDARIKALKDDFERRFEALMHRLEQSQQPRHDPMASYVEMLKAQAAAEQARLQREAEERKAKYEADARAQQELLKQQAALQEKSLEVQKEAAKAQQALMEKMFESKAAQNPVKDAVELARNMKDAFGGGAGELGSIRKVVQTAKEVAEMMGGGAPAEEDGSGAERIIKTVATGVATVAGEVGKVIRDARAEREAQEAQRVPIQAQILAQQRAQAAAHAKRLPGPAPALRIEQAAPPAPVPQPLPAPTPPPAAVQPAPPPPTQPVVTPAQAVQAHAATAQTLAFGVTADQFARVMAWISKAYADDNDPDVTAEHFRTFAFGLLGEKASETALQSLKVCDAQTLKTLLPTVEPEFTTETEKASYGAFMALLSDESGAKWIDALLKALAA